MALAPETAAWLEDLRKEGSLDDAAFNALKATFENEKVGNFVKGSVLRQADYSRQSADVQKAQKDLADAQAALKDREDKVTNFQTELGTWQAGAQVNFDKAIAEREKAEGIANAAMARLRSLAAANGLKEEDVLKDITVIPVTEKKPDTPDMSGYIRKEDLNTAAIQSVLGDATIYDLAAEYQDLTGKPLRNTRELVAEAVKAGRNLQEYVAEKLQFSDLRQKKADEEYKTRLAADVEAGVAKKLSEAGLPGNVMPGRTDLKGSPVLRQGGVPMPGREQQPGGGVPGAVAAFQAGKYQQK